MKQLDRQTTLIGTLFLLKIKLLCVRFITVHTVLGI